MIANQPKFPRPPRLGSGFKDNSNLDKLFIGENPPPKSERPSFKSDEISWDGEVLNKEYTYKFVGWTQISEISKLLTMAKSDYSNVEIHVAPSTCALTYKNRVSDATLMCNLRLVCEENEILQALSDVYGGAFDLKNKKFWINYNESINIIINKSVKKGFSYIVSNGEVVGYVEHAEMNF